MEAIQACVVCCLPKPTIDSGVLVAGDRKDGRVAGFRTTFRIGTIVSKGTSSPIPSCMNQTNAKYKIGRRQASHIPQTSLRDQAEASVAAPSASPDLVLLGLASKLEDFVDEAGAVSGSDALVGLRGEASEATLNCRWLTNKDEAYRFTDLKFLNNTSMCPVDSAIDSASAVLSSLELSESDSTLIVLVDGIFAPSLSKLDNLQEGVVASSISALPKDVLDGHVVPMLSGAAARSDGDVFASVNGVGARDLVVIFVPQGVKVPKPIEVIYISRQGLQSENPDGPVFWLSSPRLLIMVQKDAELNLVEDFIGAPDAAYWTNSVCEIIIAEGGRVGHNFAQDQNGVAVHIKKTHVSQNKICSSRDGLCNGWFTRRTNESIVPRRRQFDSQAYLEISKRSSKETQRSVSELSSAVRAVTIGAVHVDDDKSVDGSKPGDGVVDDKSDLANVLNILMPEDKFRFHKIPKFKALKLKMTPALVLQVLQHSEVRPSNKWKFFVWAKRQMNFKHTVETYNSVIVTLLDMRKFTSIRFLLEDMRRNEVALTVKSCLRMAKAFGQAGMQDSGVRSLRHMARFGSPPTSRHMNLLLSALLNGRYYVKAYEAYRELTASGFEPDSFTFKILLRGLVRVRELGLAGQIFDEMQAIGCEPDAETSSILIGVLCDAGRIDDALLVFGNFQQRGQSPNVKVYDMLLRALFESNRAVKAMEIFEEVRTHGHLNRDDTSRALLDSSLASGWMAMCKDAEDISPRSTRNPLGMKKKV